MLKAVVYTTNFYTNLQFLVFGADTSVGWVCMSIDI